jgi:acetyl-CoA C-acetyltransferase
VDDNTPVIIGVGEASERIDAPDYEALSPADLAGRAAAAALQDAGGAEALAPHIELIAAIRQFEVSGPRAVAPFGKADNFPRAVAKRIGADPARAILEPVGGQGPQHLVNELAQLIGAGQLDLALICGAEAISTVRHLTSRGESRDWSETVGGELEDRGYGEALLTADLARHGARTPISVYALFENARRARLGLSRSAYGLEMGRLFSPFTQVAAGNPHAMSREVHSPEALATVTASNRLTSAPYPRRLVARDQANQGAAVLIASLGKAKAMGVPADRLIYLHGGADVRERTPTEREDLSTSPASVMAARKALDVAGLSVEAIDVFDLYSCFPIAVFNVRDGLGIRADDPRPLTVTGGLPYFGGAGNNYSMHAIASMVRRLRANPTERGLVAANGGFLSKYSVGVYSARPASWRGFQSATLQAEVDRWTAPTVAPGEGDGVVETYTIDYGGKSPQGVIVGRLSARLARFVAMTAPTDPAIVERMIAADPIGARVTMALGEEGRSIITSIVAPSSGASGPQGETVEAMG